MRYAGASLTISLVAGSWATAAYPKTMCSAEVRAADSQFRQAMIHGDVNALDKIIADDAKIIHGNHGEVQDKHGLIDWFRSYHIDEYDRTPILCRVSGNTAVLVSATKKIAQGKVTDASTTEIFVLRGDRWRLFVLQNTDRTSR